MTNVECDESQNFYDCENINDEPLVKSETSVCGVTRTFQLRTYWKVRISPTCQP
jgi:hypothetical protein